MRFGPPIFRPSPRGLTQLKAGTTSGHAEAWVIRPLAKSLCNYSLPGLHLPEAKLR